MVTDNAEPLEEGTTVNAEQETPVQSEKSFSQEELNRLIGQKAREVRNQYSDYNQLKERAAKADELEQAQLTESERLSQRAIEAEKLASDAQSKMNETVISGEVRVRAVQLGIVDPDAAFLLMDKSSIIYDSEKGVSGVDEALNQLLEEKPYLRGSQTRSPNINPESGQVAPVSRLTADQKEAARLMGISEEQYSQGL